MDGLPEVFNPDRKPWIDADKAPGDAVADVIETCPTGALHYKMKTSDRSETAPSHNRISLQEDGPVYMYGDIEVQDHEGNVVLKDTRFAFCRCGASGNKPACDNSHKEIEFEAGTDADRSKLPEPSGERAKTDRKTDGKRSCHFGRNLHGGVRIIQIPTKVWHSAVVVQGTKPFCDGSKGVGDLFAGAEDHPQNLFVMEHIRVSGFEG